MVHCTQLRAIFFIANISLPDLVRLQSSPDHRLLWRNLPRYSDLVFKCDMDGLWSYWDLYYREVVRDAASKAFPPPCQPGELRKENPLLQYAEAAQPCCRMFDQYRNSTEGNQCRISHR
jgi:hypothetical protein